MSDRMIQVQTSSPKDEWLVRQGDEVRLDVPGGRVTLALHGGWSESGIAYTRLSYEPIRSGLVRFGEGPTRAPVVCVICGTQEDLRIAPIMTGDQFGQTPQQPVCGECAAEGILRVRGLTT